MKQKQGYTIIETIVCAAVLAIMLVGLYMVFMSGTKSWFSEESVLNVQEIAREVLRGKGSGDWRGMAAEIRGLHRIIAPFPHDLATNTSLSTFRLRFIGEACIYAGANRLVQTLRRTGSDDIQLIATATICATVTTVVITAGRDGILQSVPGDIDGDGDVDGIPAPDDYTDALVINGLDNVCNTNAVGDDVQEVDNGAACGMGDILVSPGTDKNLQTLPPANHDDFRGGSVVIGYELSPQTKQIVRTINDLPPVHSRGDIGPYIVAKNIEAVEFHYFQSDGLSEVLPGTATQASLNTITQIEIIGTVSITKKSGEELKAPFKTRIQPRSLNSSYTMGQ